MRTRRTAIASFLGAALAMGAANAPAQPYPDPPAPGAPRPLAVAPPSEFTLANGMRVVLAERRGVRLVTAELLVMTGSEADPPQLAGLAALTATLLTRGTRERSAPELATAAEALGGSLDSDAGWDQSAVSITVAEPLLDDALALVAQVVASPAFAQDELDRARAQALDGLKVADAQPGSVAARAANRVLFGAAPYGHPANGTPQSLARITRADLQRLHQAHYRPDNAVLVLAGDLDEKQARALAQRHFGSWKPARGAAPATASATTAASAPANTRQPDSLPEALTLIDMPGAGQAAVVLVTPAPPGRRDRAIGQLANAVLGGGYSSRLNQEIRVRRGLSYGAGSRLDARRDAGLLGASVQTRNETAAEVVGLMHAEFDRLIAAPVPAGELAARKAMLIGAFSRGVETTAGLAGAIGTLLVAGLPADEIGRRIDALSAVTAGQVQRYAAEWLAPARRRVVVAGDAARFGPPMKAYAPAAPTIRQDALDLENGAALTH